MTPLIETKEVRESSYEKKIHNVTELSNLSRDGLGHSIKERRLRLFSYANEITYIQYPGKETIRENAPKPWDFRPKLFYGDMQLPDLSFKMIWDDLVELSASCSRETLQKLAAVFYRMSILYDHKKICDNFHYDDINLETGVVTNRGEIMLSLNMLDINSPAIVELSKEIPFIRNISLASYLVYNDLLAQNEDCKYYYRDTYEKNKKWDGKIGRQNNLLTHVTIIQYLLGQIHLTTMIDKFMRGYGVAPITNSDEIKDVTGDLIERVK